MATATPAPTASKVNRNYNRTYRMMWNALNTGVLNEHHFRTLKATIAEKDYQMAMYNALKNFTLTTTTIKLINSGGVPKHSNMYKKFFKELTIENMKKLVVEFNELACYIFQHYIYIFAPLEVLEYMYPYLGSRISEILVSERIFTCRKTRPSIVAWRIARNYHMRRNR
jgi:hypothetical protein